MVVEEDVLEYLEHFGVKGQRWGVRRARTRSSGARKPRSASEKSFNRKRIAASVAIGLGAAFIGRQKFLLNKPATIAVGGVSAVAATALIERHHNKKNV